MRSAVIKSRSPVEELPPVPRWSASPRNRTSPVSVLHIDTERGWRGGERQVLWLAESLTRSGNQCVIAARPGEPLAQRAADRGLRVLPFAPRWEFDPLAASALARFVDREGIEIVHCHTAHATSIALLGAGRAKRVITRRVDFKVGRDWMSQLKYRRADAIIAISEAVATSLVASGISRARIEIIPSGVDLSRCVAQPAKGTLRLLGIPDGARLVVMVAALASHKDPLTFVRAMGRVVATDPTVHALIIGDGPLRPAVESAVAELDLSRNVHLAGYRSDPDTLIAAADVVALSSTKEGLGTVLLDALWMGKAVAATRAGGIPEIVEDGVCGILSPPGDAVALGATITQLLRDDALRARLGAAGRSRAAAFSIERTATRTALVYQRVNAIRA